MIRLDRIVLKALHRLYADSHPWKQGPEVVSDANDASMMIRRALQSDEPAMICRYGSVELMNVTNWLSISSGRRPVLRYIRDEVREWWWNEVNVSQMQSNAGFFPNTEDNLARFAKMIVEDTRQVDILGSWTEYEKFIELPDSVRKVTLQNLEPFWSDIPWTSELKGKKVLVVHPFASLIEDQYRNHRTDIFTGRDVLPEFELKTLAAVQSIGGRAVGFNDWFEALEFMKGEIDKVDYDVCLIGCGAYGFPLAAHVKRSGKKAVHLGGALQLLFGIKGKRWDDPDYGKTRGIPRGAYLSLMNDCWVRPGESLKPDSADRVEGGCYW